MKSCPDRRETLLMDAFGELTPHERVDWEGHLRECPACRKEKERLALLFRRVEEGLGSHELSEEEAQGLTRSILEGFQGERSGFWRKRVLWFRSVRLFPALAAACGVLVALGWVSVKELHKGFRVSSHPSRAALVQGMSKEELELLKNMELLEEMDALKKLVKVVDHRDVI